MIALAASALAQRDFDAQHCGDEGRIRKQRIHRWVAEERVEDHRMRSDIEEHGLARALQREIEAIAVAFPRAWR